MINGNPGHRIDAAARTMGIALITMIGLMMTVRFLHYCNSGFDFTDESYFINCVEYPEFCDINVTQFGHVYAPLWRATGKNLAVYRQANIVILLLLSFALSFTLLRRAGGDASRWTTAAIAFGAATIIHSFLFFFYPTPSYNSLALQALLLTAIGIVLLPPRESPSNRISWLLIGLGGALAFLAKPTTAAALALFVAIYWFFSGKLRCAPLLGACATSLLALLTFGWATHGSPLQFISDLREGFQDMRILGYQKSIFRLEPPILLAKDFAILCAMLVVSAIGVIMSAYRAGSVVNLDRTPLARSISRTVWCIIVMVSGYSSLMLLLGSSQWPAPWWPMLLGPLFISLGGTVGSLASWPRLSSSGSRRETWLRAGLFIVLPYAYVFGSSDLYSLHMQFAGAFWLLAGLGLIADLAPSVGGHCAMILLIAANQVFVITGVNQSILTPPRQRALPDNHETVKLGDGGASILVSIPTARLFREMRDIADRGGFKPGMGLLDLTGWYPGIAFVLGAKPVGRAWSLGGFQGRIEAAQRYLDRAGSEVIRRAWVLTGRPSERSIPESVLDRYGLSLDRDFVLAGEASHQEFRLYRPVEPQLGK